MVSKKLWYIIGGVVVVAIIVWALAANMHWLPNGYQQMTNSNGSQTYSNNEGSVTVGSGMPSQWPQDAPGNYAGAQIIYSGNTNPKTGKPGVAVSYLVKNAKATDIATYYRQNLAARDWKIVGDANVSGQIILGATKDTRTFAVSISDNGNGNITVTAGLELQ